MSGLPDLSAVRTWRAPSGQPASPPPPLGFYWVVFSPNVNEEFIPDLTWEIFCRTWPFMPSVSWLGQRWLRTGRGGAQMLHWALLGGTFIVLRGGWGHVFSDTVVPSAPDVPCSSRSSGSQGWEGWREAVGQQISGPGIFTLGVGGGSGSFSSLMALWGRWGGCVGGNCFLR